MSKQRLTYKELRAIKDRDEDTNMQEVSKIVYSDRRKLLAEIDLLKELVEKKVQEKTELMNRFHNEIKDMTDRLNQIANIAQKQIEN